MGTALVSDRESWVDIRDVSWTAKAYMTSEPFVDYVRDLRCLAGGEDIWAMERRSRF